MACGSPDDAIPLGKVIAGTPALLQGAQSEPSPVEPRPAGAGVGAVGDSSASCAAKTPRLTARAVFRSRRPHFLPVPFGVSGAG